jgi:predicted nucleotidyltransferase component of viral defense system
MTRVRRNPDSSDSVRTRLAAIAAERQADFQAVLTEFATERFLYRLGASAHASRFVLKGATLLTLWQLDRRRATWDIDLHAPSRATVQEIVAVIREILRTPAADAIRFDETTLEADEIRTRNVHGGVTVRIDAMLGVAQIPMQIDVGFGDAILPPAAQAEFPVLLDHPAPVVAVYPRESVVAEKSEAILTLGATNSRMKDFYDLFVFSRAFAFAGPILVASVEATFRHRGTAIPDELPFALTTAFMADPSRAVQWRAFLRRSRLDAEPDPANVVKAITMFLWPPLCAVRDVVPFTQMWKPGGPWTPGAV